MKRIFKVIGKHLMNMVVDYITHNVEGWLKYFNKHNSTEDSNSSDNFLDMQFQHKKKTKKCHKTHKTFRKRKRRRLTH